MAGRATNTLGVEQLEDTLKALEKRKTVLLNIHALNGSEHGAIAAGSTGLIDEQMARSILTTARNTVSNHNSQLQKYNELRDTAMIMMGLIAEQRGVTLKTVMADMDIEDTE